MKSCIVAILCLILVSYHSYGNENSSFSFSSITKGSNLYSGNIDGLLKDSNGYIWYHSHGSLFQFDGEDWQKIGTSLDTDKFTNKVALHGSLKEDKWRNLWLGNDHGLFYYKSKIGQMERVNGILKKNTNSFPNISQITVFSDKVLFFLADNQPYKLEYDYNPDSDELSIQSIEALLQDSEIAIHVLTRLKSGNIGFFSNQFFGEYNPQNSEIDWKQLPSPVTLDANPAMHSMIYCDQKGVLWLGTQQYGIYVYDPQSGELKNYQSVDGKRIRHINDISGDQSGNVWVATTEGMVRLFEEDGVVHLESIGTDHEIDELYLEYINSIYSDEEGYLLLLAQGGEVLKLEPSNQLFNFLPINKGFNVAPIYSAFSDIKVSPEGKICKLRSNRFSSTIVSVRHDIKKEEEVYKYVKRGDRIIAFEFVQGQLWVGTLRSGLLILDEKNQKESQQIMNQPLLDFFKDKAVARIIKCSDQLLYFILENGIVYVVVNDDKGVWSWTQKKKRLQLYTLHATPMLCTSDNWFWCANPLNTLIGFGPEGQEKEFTFDESIAISALCELSEGNLLVGSYGGLRQINIASGDVKRIKSFDNVSIFNIVPEDQTHEVFWLTSYKKLFRYNSQTGKTDVVGQERGLPNCRFQTNSNVVLSNGHIGFGTLRKGILHFSPQTVQLASQPLEVKISGVKVNGISVLQNNENKEVYPILDYKFPFAKNIKLKHNQRLISFRFSALNYKQPQNVMYSYFLEGVDSEWNNVVHSFNEVTYSNLKPGDYTFRVKATSTPGVWGGEESLFNISIEPAWYQTRIAKVSFVIIVILLIVFFWHYSIGKIKLGEQLKREKAERDKDNEMHKLRLQFFTNISHEFKTPLTLLFGPLNQLRNSELSLSGFEKERLYDLMSKNINHLMKMINQLMDFRKVSNSAMTLRVRPTNISRFIEEQCLKFKQEVESQEKTIILDNNSGDLIYGWVDSEKLLRILDNLLSNAVKFTPANGVIQLIVKKEKEGVELQVCDNGVGIAAQHLPFIFQRYYRVEDDQDHIVQVPGTGIGLALCSDLAELMKGKISVESTPGKGTCFRFWFPIDSASFVDVEKDVLDEDKSIVEVSSPSNLKEEDAAEERNKPLVLIVEDNKDMQSFIGSILSDDYILEYASNGFEGIEKCDRLAPDLVVSDVMMPEMGGFEMVEKLKTDVRISHIPIILLTALSSAKHQVQGMESGADLYIAKPFDPEYLKTSIGNLIKSRAKLRQQFGKKLIDVKTSEITITRTDEVFLDNIMKIIGERLFDSDFKIEDIYTEVGMSRSQFFRKIKALTDQTAGDFVKSLRLKKAAELLLNQGIRVSDVCYEVGFTDPKYFTKVFKKHFGMSPTEYIKSKESNS